jgi:hypothetical protein
MKIYIAGRYKKREEFLLKAEQLISLGHTITSRRLNGSHEINKHADADWQRTNFALDDWLDVISADAIINFTEEPRSCNSRGGRHVEFGVALARSKICYIIGPRENVFHYMPEVITYDNWEDFLSNEGFRQKEPEKDKI